MVASKTDFLVEIFKSREKSLPTDKFSYKLAGGNTSFGQFGLDIVIPDEMDFDQGRMSVVIPFADGNRVDGVGDVTEVTGLHLERHKRNPISLFDHGKKVELPIGLSEDPHTGIYTVEIDATARTAKGNVFFYQGGGLEGVDSKKDYDHSLYCEQLYDMLVKRLIRGGSFGYQIIRAQPLQPDYSSNSPQGLHLYETLLLEYGPTVLPANQDTVRKMLCMGRCCGKSLSPMLVKSLTPFAAPKKAQMGYEKKPHECPCEGACQECKDKQLTGKVQVPHGDMSETHVPPATWNPGQGAKINKRPSFKDLRMKYRKKSGEAERDPYSESDDVPLAGGEGGSTATYGGLGDPSMRSNAPSIRRGIVNEPGEVRQNSLKSKKKSGPAGERNFFANCPRDETGHCKPKGETPTPPTTPASSQEAIEKRGEVAPERPSQTPPAKPGQGHHGPGHTAMGANSAKPEHTHKLSDEEQSKVRARTDQLLKEKGEEHKHKQAKDAERDGVFLEKIKKEGGKTGTRFLGEADKHSLRRLVQSGKLVKKGAHYHISGKALKSQFAGDLNWLKEEQDETEHKSFHNLRRKYKGQAKGFRRRLRKSSPGSSLVFVKDKDLNACKKTCVQKGIQIKELGKHISGCIKLKLMGDDGAIDEVAKSFGRPLKGLQHTKSLNSEKGISMGKTLKKRTKDLEPEIEHDKDIGEPASGQDDLDTGGGIEKPGGEVPANEPLDEIPTEEGQDPSQMAPEEVEPYSAQVLRRMHNDAKFLMEAYDQMGGPLEHDGIKKHLLQKLEALESELSDIEGLFDEHHQDLPGLEGAMGVEDEEGPELEEEEEPEEEEEETPEEEEAEGEVEEPLAEETVEADSEEPEEPEPEEAVEGMEKDEKSLKGKNKSQPSNGISPKKARQILEDGEVRGHPITDKQRGMFGAAANRGKKSLCPVCHKDPCICDSEKKSLLRRYKLLKKQLGIENGHTPGGEAKREEKKKCAMKSQKKDMDPSSNQGMGIEGDAVPGGEEHHQDLGLQSHEKDHIKEAVSFLDDLSTTRDFGDDHRNKSYHHHKALEGVGNRLKDNLNKLGLGETPDLSGAPQANTEPGEVHTKEMPADAQPPAQQVAEGEGDGQLVEHAQRAMAWHKALTEAGDFFRNLSKEHNYGEEHRVEALMHHKSLHPLTKDMEENPGMEGGDGGSEGGEGYDTKTLKKLFVHQSQTLQELNKKLAALVS